ncbi:MAG: hypothetical protein IJZ96_07590 [Lachnospiraceae bacterium]|nr:hypothetical protein [Lachnospiraceae bacterium]
MTLIFKIYITIVLIAVPILGFIHTGLFDYFLDNLTMSVEEKKTEIIKMNNVDDYLIFYIFSRNRFKRVCINISKLSKVTCMQLKEVIQIPLLNIYAEAKYNKEAKKAFKANSIYLITIAEDLKKAIAQCDTEKMEMIMCSRLHILGNSIAEIKESVDEAVQNKEYQEKVLDDLKAESYEPFTMTDSMNKLLK